MKQKTLVEKFAYWARNARSAALFEALKEFCQGEVLDVGGRDFFLTARDIPLAFTKWTTLDATEEHLLNVEGDGRFQAVMGDGCAMTFADGSFDTVINLQVLEHVFDPVKMVAEIARVLKDGGHGIFLIPQTAVLHELPQHYYNFTPYWIEEVMPRCGMEIILSRPLGGVWSSMASHLVYFFFQCHRAKGYSSEKFKRNGWFYLLYPLMLVYALLNIPVCLLLSAGDLTEEPNNHLVVVRKKERGLTS